ncbi:MAG TPA: hypothetical protein VIF15_17715 [Polyangiaceae bacterium]|jgi:hypothetical protein
MRWAHALVAVSLATPALALASGCSDATGSARGAQALTDDACAATGGGHTWTDLYTCYFGPTGKASCSAQAFCHSQPDGTGTQASFLCGTSKESCFQGLSALASPVDILTGALRKNGGQATDNLLGNMPCNPSPLPDGKISCPAPPDVGRAYTFTQDDLDRISAWIHEGAQDN